MQRPHPFRVRSAPRPTLLAALVLGWTGLASAQTPAGSGSSAEPAPTAAVDTSQNRFDPRSPGMRIVDDTEPLPPLVPRSKDLLAGHVLLGASAAPTWSVGRLGSHLTALDAVGAGFAVKADAGIGVSRTFVLGLWGGLARYSDGNECNSCKGQAFEIGPFVRYHLTQGLRFVPWVLGGVAYRSLTVDSLGGGQELDHAKLSGMSWLRFELGGDYYAFSGFGLGPFGGLALTSYWDRPESAGDARVSTELTVGLRLLLDVPGR